MKLFLICYLGIVTSLVYLLFQDDTLEASMARGKQIYADFCVTCHLPTGSGVADTYPPLANSDYLRDNQEKSIRGIKYGQRGEMMVNGTIYNNTMMPMGLEDDEIADVMNYINNSWGNKNSKRITAAEVTAIVKP